MTVLLRMLSSVGMSGESKMGSVTRSAYGIMYISACIHVGNKITAAISMYLGSVMIRIVRIMSDVRLNGKTNTAACNRKWVWNNV